MEQAVRTAEPTSGEPVGQVMELALSNVGVTSALDLFLDIFFDSLSPAPKVATESSQ